MGSSCQHKFLWTKSEDDSFELLEREFSSRKKSKEKSFLDKKKTELTFHAQIG